MKSEALWATLKQNKVLEDEEARKHVTWGSILATDQFIYDDLNFKTVIRASDTMDKKVAVKMNTSNQTIKISLDGSDEPPLYANMAQMEVMKRKHVVIPKGQSATISIENSYPTVMFAGTF